MFLYPVILYPPPCRQAPVECLSNALVPWILGSVLLRDHRGVYQIDFDRSHDVFAGIFLLCIIFFYVNTKKQPNMESIGPKSMKHVSVAISEKVSKIAPGILICFARFQEADVVKT